MPKAPITNITSGTMTLGYRGYGARVHDAATADAMLGAVLEFGHDQLDTCSVYGDGTCEQMLGDRGRDCLVDLRGTITRLRTCACYQLKSKWSPFLRSWHYRFFLSRHPVDSSSEGL